MAAAVLQMPSDASAGTSQLSQQASGSLAGTSAEPRKISTADVQLVQNLIERCLQLYMSQREVVFTLNQQAKIEPNFTLLVWQKLEEQNPDFFRAYYTRCAGGQVAGLIKLLRCKPFSLLPPERLEALP